MRAVRVVRHGRPSEAIEIGDVAVPEPGPGEARVAVAAAAAASLNFGDIAVHWTSMLEECVARTDAFRAAHPQHPIIDVHYADLVADPLATVAALYDALDIDLSGAARQAMAAEVAARPKGAFGTHGYDLASLGLDRPELRDRFAGYVSRYGVPVEAGA